MEHQHDDRFYSSIQLPQTSPSGNPDLGPERVTSNASSSSSSSTVELANIALRSFSLDLGQASPFAHGRISKISKTRRQHTLDSIGSEKSRSRSPIVVAPIDSSSRPDRCKNSRDDLKDTMDSVLKPSLVKSSRNPFEIFDQNQPRNGAHNLGPIETISLQSFERRRSIYESEPIELVRRTANPSMGTSAISDEPAEDNLSLDRILDDLQSGKLEVSSQLTCATMPCIDHLGQESSQMELREFKQNSETFQVTCSSGSSSSEISTAASNITLGKPRRRNGNAGHRQHELATGFEIVWLNFTYSVEPTIFEDPRWGKINSLFHKESREILKGLSGGLKSGQMVALMGPSGAGKTCLLECISGIRLTGIGGQLCLRGRKRAQLVIVPQYDDFMPQFSVEEIIVYGSKMKNSARTDHQAIADNVIQQLGLQGCRSNNIQQCSGGQRKRVAIAQELVSRPNILILDEPTSGLDSSCCYQTMRVLRDVLDQSVHTEQPMAIVTTIHQPSAKVFKMFDSIYLLGKTGFAAYSGPPDDLLPTIRHVTGLECPQYSNPSDYMIELVSYDYGEEPVEKLIEFEKKKAKQFVKDYELRAGIKLASDCSISARLNGTTAPITNLKSSKSDTHLIIENNGGGNEAQLHRLKALRQSAAQHVEYKNNVSISLRKATSSSGVSHPFLWHTFIHFHRSFLQSIRDPILNNMRILIHLGFATLLVLLYGKKSGEARGCPPILGLPTEITDPNNESMIDLADNVGYLFMCIMMITYVSLMSTVLTFPIDIKTVGKEYKNGWYGTITYFLGKSIADLPFIIVYPVCYCLITWFITNQAQDHTWRYFSFTGLIIMNAMNSQSFGLILGALFVNSVTAATFLGPVITIPWYLFTGFTKRVHRLAEPYKTTSRFLFTRYVFEGLLDTVYGHQRCNCSEFLEKYYELRYEEALRIGHMISVETLSSLDYYDGLDKVADLGNKSLFRQSTGSQWFEKTVDAASTVFADGEDLNLAGLMDTNVKASSLFSFGLDFEPTCPSNYKNYVVQDFRLGDKTAENAFITTFFMLAVIRVLTFILVAWKIRTRQL